jgi:hypothetical protein
MAVPWQADFFDCTKETVSYSAGAADPALESTDVMTWWPTHRPDDVLTRGALDRVPWARLKDGREIDTMEKFLTGWRGPDIVVSPAGDRSRLEEVARCESESSRETIETTTLE